MTMTTATIKNTTGTLGYGAGFVNGIARYMTGLADRDYRRRGAADSAGCFMSGSLGSADGIDDDTMSAPKSDP